ncbi:hypothetical protein QFC20_006971 [Naganishia adeliensis]|uniref:Uncharacterized protein n=1 Tax=Naganishia adeliensis TaxID=92952 RepID=A0ACC2V5K9_9TREE|nr:hypothetical protein QFC20_006971 [Naganishia adeliensis]
MDDQPTQTTDISALPIDQQMEHILRTKLDVQELIKLLHAFSQKTYTPAQWEVEKKRLASTA